MWRSRVVQFCSARPVHFLSALDRWGLRGQDQAVLLSRLPKRVAQMRVSRAGLCLEVPPELVRRHKPVAGEGEGAGAGDFIALARPGRQSLLLWAAYCGARSWANLCANFSLIGPDSGPLASEPCSRLELTADSWPRHQAAITFQSVGENCRPGPCVRKRCRVSPCSQVSVLSWCQVSAKRCCPTS